MSEESDSDDEISMLTRRFKRFIRRKIYSLRKKGFSREGSKDKDKEKEKKATDGVLQM